VDVAEKKDEKLEGGEWRQTAPYLGSVYVNSVSQSLI
jgi:hypothetical protein